MCFLKKVKIQHVEISIQPVVLHLVDFENDLKNLNLFDFALIPTHVYARVHITVHKITRKTSVS